MRIIDNYIMPILHLALTFSGHCVMDKSRHVFNCLSTGNEPA